MLVSIDSKDHPALYTSASSDKLSQRQTSTTGFRTFNNPLLLIRRPSAGNTGLNLFPVFQAAGHARLILLPRLYTFVQCPCVSLSVQRRRRAFSCVVISITVVKSESAARRNRQSSFIRSPLDAFHLPLSFAVSRRFAYPPSATNFLLFSLSLSLSLSLSVCLSLFLSFVLLSFSFHQTSEGSKFTVRQDPVKFERMFRDV